jgi:hypothetical protein
MREGCAWRSLLGFGARRRKAMPPGGVATPLELDGVDLSADWHSKGRLARCKPERPFTIANKPDIRQHLFADGP